MSTVVLSEEQNRYLEEIKLNVGEASKITYLSSLQKQWYFNVKIAEMV